MKITRRGRDILKAAHKTPQTEETLGHDLGEAVILVGSGLLTTTPEGFAITSDGARAIGKSPPSSEGALVGAVAANLDDLVPAAVSLIQTHHALTGNEEEDGQSAMVLLMTLCVAVGILARVVAVDAVECMRAISLGRKVRLHESPERGGL